MSLPDGTRIGPFEILSALGAGGMGQVYRARDPQLNREVAIKVLLPDVTADPDRIARFRREARVLASLNHPNIAYIHGLEEAGGVTALVLELIEGEDLAQRIRRGPLPIEDALPIARQIGEALEAAHNLGIIHRDLKPANIKVRPDGVVKVLDFGLAKAIDRPGSSGAADGPTITAAVMTSAGSILGTAAYMSPEQAKGQVVDQRADIWAFGCVFFELLTGRRTFSGETIPGTIAAVLEREPDWSRLPASTPTAIRPVLARCLEKDPKRRWRNVADVLIALDDAPIRTTPDGGAAPTGARWRERAAWVASIAVIAAAALLMPSLRKPSAPAEVRFDLSYPRDLAADFAQLAISPDGTQLVAAPSAGVRAPLWLRPLADTAGRKLPGTEGATLPFWSPDGRSIGFFVDGKLKRFDVDSEATRILADAPTGRGGAWQPDGAILFAPNAKGPLARVPATGGQSSLVTVLVEGQNDHRAPVVLPGGRHFLYYARGTAQVRGVYVARMDGSEPQRLLDADSAAVYASGHLLFARQDELLAQAFDPARLTLKGAATRIASGVSVDTGVSLASIAASPAGAIVYGTGAVRRTQLTWFDRAGKPLGTVGPADQTNLANPSLSPDGGQVAFRRTTGGNSDVWLMNMQGAMNRLTSNLGLESNPLWSPNGRHVFYQSGSSVIYSRAVNDTTSEERVLSRSDLIYPSDVSADGHVLLFNRSSGSPLDLWYLSLVGDDRTPHAFVETPFAERDGQFSPDGKWVAYQSNDSGHEEIYVRPFPGPGERIPVSAGGGQQVRWASRGSELFYLAADQRLTSVPVTFTAQGALVLGAPVALFRVESERAFPTRQQYMVAPGADRFLVNTRTDGVDPPSLTVVLNWRPQP